MRTIDSWKFGKNQQIKTAKMNILSFANQSMTDPKLRIDLSAKNISNIKIKNTDKLKRSYRIQPIDRTQKETVKA